MPKLGLKTELWSHQAAAANYAYKREGTLLNCAMGTGKTLISVALLHAWDAKRVLVVCPKSVIGVWPGELAKHSSWEWHVARCDKGGVVAKTAIARETCDKAGVLGERCVVVINHESAWREPFAKFVRQREWDVLIVDESHRAKAPGGKFSFWLNRIQDRFPRRLALTGTPLPHSPLDIYAQARFLAPGLFARTFTEFKHRFALMGGPLMKQVVGYQNMDRYFRCFQRLAYSVTKEEALDLPPEVDEYREADLEPKAARVYSDVARDFWAEVDAGTITVANALVKLLRLQQITSGDVPLDDGETQALHTVSEAKAQLLRDVLEDTPPDDPVVVFCRFRQDLERVRYIAGAMGRVYHEVSGQYHELTEDEKMLPDTEILGVQIQSGGLGIDLTRSATAIYYSLGFSLGDYLQSRARLHRPGQTRSVTYLHLSCRGTVDEKVIAALAARQQVVEAILRGEV